MNADNVFHDNAVLNVKKAKTIRMVVISAKIKYSNAYLAEIMKMIIKEKK